MFLDPLLSPDVPDRHPTLPSLKRERISGEGVWDEDNYPVSSPVY